MHKVWPLKETQSKKCAEPSHSSLKLITNLLALQSYMYLCTYVDRLKWRYIPPFVEVKAFMSQVGRVGEASTLP